MLHSLGAGLGKHGSCEALRQLAKVELSELELEDSSNKCPKMHQQTTFTYDIMTLLTLQHIA